MKYIGEFPIDEAIHPVYSKFTPADWAMVFIGKYSSIDGDHHKAWCFDQVARILKGTRVIVLQARWDGNKLEDRFVVANPPSEAYTEWVKQMTTGVNSEYDWDVGIAP